MRRHFEAGPVFHRAFKRALGRALAPLASNRRALGRLREIVALATGTDPRESPWNQAGDLSSVIGLVVHFGEAPSRIHEPRHGRTYWRLEGRRQARLPLVAKPAGLWIVEGPGIPSAVAALSLYREEDTGLWRSRHIYSLPDVAAEVEQGLRAADAFLWASRASSSPALISLPLDPAANPRGRAAREKIQAAIGGPARG